MRPKKVKEKGIKRDQKYRLLGGVGDIKKLRFGRIMVGSLSF